MTSKTITALIATLLVAGCGVGNETNIGSRTTVQNVGSDDLLKLRAGPGLNYDILMGLPDDTPLIRRQCVTEVGQLWCKVALAKSPGVEGYVSADYLARK